MVDNFRASERPGPASWNVQLEPYSVYEDNTPWLQQYIRFVEENTKHVSNLYVWGNPVLMGMAKERRTKFYLDGTFRVCPEGFIQLLILMMYSETLEIYVPLFYGLIDSKTFHGYWKFITTCHEIVNCKMDPESFTCDFDPAQIKAIRGTITESKLIELVHFPKTVIIGCLFHLKQCWRRKLVSLSLDSNLVENAMASGSLDILCILEKKHILAGIKYLRDKFEKNQSLETKKKWESFWTYFQSTWYHPKKKTTYDLDTWNISAHYENEIEVQNRTNNPLERYNRHLNSLFPESGPSLYHLNDKLKLESKRVQQTVELVRHNVAKPPVYKEVTYPDLPEDLFMILD